MSDLLITQQLEDTPTIILVGKKTVLLDKITQLILDVGLQTLSTTSDELEKIQHQLRLAYKVVWFLDFTESEVTLNQVSALLKNVAEKTVVVAPIIQPIEDDGHDEFSELVTVSTIQKRIITHCSNELSESFFIFGAEILHPQLPSLLSILLKNIDKSNIIIDPKIEIGTLSLDDFVVAINELLFRPGSQQSVCVFCQGSTSQSLKIALDAYNNYHTSERKIVIHKAKKQPIVPFTVKTIEKPSDDSALHSFIQTLPTPTRIVLPNTNIDLKKPLPPSVKVKSSAEPALLPAFKKNTIKNEKRALGDQQVKNVQIPIVPEEKKVLEVDVVSVKPITTGELSSEVADLFSSQRVEKKVQRIVNVARSEKKQELKSTRRTWFFYSGLVFLGVSLGILALFGFFQLSHWYVKQQVLQVVEATSQQLPVEEAQWRKIITANKILATQLRSYGVFIDNNFLNSAEVVLTLSNNLVSTRDYASKTEDSAKKAFLGVFGGTTTNTGILAQNIASEARQTYDGIVQVQNSLEQIDLGVSNDVTTAAVTTFSEEIHSLRKQLLVQQQLLPLMGWLSGEEGKKTYAILLQNNQEMRPTGGFIQAVALLTFQDGTLINSQVYSADEIDSRVVGQVLPPEEIKQNLGETTWYFRDSNWDPDFPTTATSVAWFLEESLQTEVDGVIALNLKSMEILLKSLGPIDLPEHNEVITHLNIAERMEFHSEVVLLDSESVTDYSTDLLKAFIHKFTTTPEDKVLLVLDAVFNAFESHEMYFSLLDEEKNAVLSTLTWNGALVHPTCPPQLQADNCEVDSFAQVDANVGVNKANYYLERTVIHDIVLGQESAHHTRVITIRNTADSAAWPRGPYQAYVRFYMPEDAELGSVSIDGAIVDKKDIFERDEHGFQVAGLRIDVPTSEEKIISFEFTSPIKNTDENTLTYAFFEQKQSGWNNALSRVRITHDPSLSPTRIAPKASVNDMTITYATEDTSHLFVGGQFVHK